MIHFGDICKIKGDAVPSVDVITGGSPCQDLSVAGKRAGLEGERSGLFMEQIRVIKEMRNECIRRLEMRGADVDIRCISPRYMVWENVPGAFSSNKGEDFRCVLEETAKVADENAVIPRLEEGAKWSNSGLIVGNGRYGTYSIGWLLHDLQYHGCPQRRRRLCVLADFNGNTAGEILFELQRETAHTESDQTITDIGAKSRPEVQPIGKSLSRDIEPSGEEGQETSSIAQSNLGTAMSFQERAGRPGGGKGLLIQNERTGALATHPQSVCHETVASFYPQMKAESQCFRDDDVSNTLVNGTNPGFHNGIVVKEEPILLESNQNHATVQTDGVSTALPASMGMGGGYVPMITEQQGMAYQAHGTYKESDVVSSCKCRDYKDATDLVVEPIAFEPGAASRVGGHIYEDGKTGTIRADAGDNQQAVVSYVEVETEVQVRKYPVDIPKLIECIQAHRCMKVGEVAEKLNKPKTLVEHWFRKDKYFAIPDADIWFDLKSLLGIETDEFDESITTFETQPGKFDMQNRIHMGETAPTQTANGENTMYCVPDTTGSLCASGYDKLGTQEAQNGMYVIQQSWDGTQVAPTLTAKNAGGEQRMPDKDNFNAVITYGLDRASFNQGKNAQFNFSVEEEMAQTLVNRGPGGGTHGEIVNALCASDMKGISNQYVSDGKCVIQFPNKEDS